VIELSGSPLLGRAGAVDAPQQPDGSPSIDAGVAHHYGDPLREQRSLVPGGPGLVDLSHRPVLQVSGPDRLSWLHSLSTQHVDALGEGDSALNLILSPHGHVEHELHMVDTGTVTLIGTEPGTADALRDFLDKMRFMLRVEVSDVTAEWAVVWEPVRERASEHPTWLTPESYARGVDGNVFVGREVFVPRADLEAYAADRDLAGTWAWEAVRVAAGVPRLGHETDHRTIPHELGWIGADAAVHLQKGCYRGQETVARVHNLGRPPRRLVLLHLDGSHGDLPVHGDPVELDGRAIGFVGTVVQHHELGPIASAVVKRSIATDAVLSAGGVSASQEVVVLP
jgi:tRNA-modifying protein YgfZ